MQAVARPGKVGFVPIYVALLRGINVGGSRSLKMTDLKAAFEQAGCTNVATYIQSGNVVFAHAVKSEATLRDLLEAALAKKAGFEVDVVLRTRSELAKVIAHNPFGRAKPEQLHVFFLPQKPASSVLSAIDAKPFAPEAFALEGREVYLFLPNGLGRSKLAVTLMRKLKDATARNWRTTEKLVAMSSPAP
jgi:uncharacterized protein (DUF1697 family)